MRGAPSAACSLTFVEGENSCSKYLAREYLAPAHSPTRDGHGSPDLGPAARSSNSENNVGIYRAARLFLVFAQPAAVFTRNAMASCRYCYHLVRAAARVCSETTSR